MNPLHLAITVYGRVQGVFFRASTKEKAESLGIKGWVRNQPDGSVYLEAEGDPDSLNELLNWVKKGPPGAHVTHVEVRKGPLQNYSRFEIQT